MFFADRILVLGRGVFFLLVLHLPFWLFVLQEMSLGHLEPLVGGLFENGVVMLAMSSFFVAFIAVPILLFNLKSRFKEVKKLRNIQIFLVSFLSASFFLFYVTLLPLNSFSILEMSIILAAGGVTFAFLFQRVVVVLQRRFI